MDIWKYFSYSGRQHTPTSHEQVLGQLKQGSLLLKNRMAIASREQRDMREGFTNAQLAELPPSIQKDIVRLEYIHTEFVEMIEELISLKALYHASLQDYKDRIMSGLAGKNILIGEDVYYITKYGYSRKYGTMTSRTWTDTCGGEPIEQDRSLSELNVLEGPPMKETSVCGYEGTNVRYKDKVAYVKMNGEILLYNDPVQVGDVVSCPTDITDVDEEVWTKLMTDKIGDIQQSTRCKIEAEMMNIMTPGPKRIPIKEAIDELMATIQNGAVAIQTLLDKKIRPLIAQLDTLDVHKKQELETYFDELDKIAKMYSKPNDTLDALMENTRLMERQNYYQYIGYFIVLLLGFVALYYVANKIGGLAKQVSQSVEFVGDKVSGFGRGAPRQSVLRREAKDANAFGGVGFGISSLNPFAKSTPDKVSTPANPERPARPSPTKTPKPVPRTSPGGQGGPGGGLLNVMKSPLSSVGTLF